MIAVRELMSVNPVTVAANATIRESLRLLCTLESRHLPVVDQAGKLVGMLSDRDLCGLTRPYLIPDEYVGYGPGVLEAHVADLMTSGPLSVGPDADIAKAMDLILENRVGAVPVVDDDEKVMGIVSYVDILQAVRQGLMGQVDPAGPR